MRTAYRVLAYVIAAVVAIQAAAIGYGVFAQLNWIDKGGTLDKATLEGSWPGSGALIFHALEGLAVFIVALALLIVSFFAKIDKGVRWAVIVLAATFVQIALGTLSHLVTASGAVHGAFALDLVRTRGHGGNASSQAELRSGGDTGTGCVTGDSKDGGPPVDAGTTHCCSGRDAGDPCTDRLAMAVQPGGQ